MGFLVQQQCSFSFKSVFRAVLGSPIEEASGNVVHPDCRTRGTLETPDPVTTKATRQGGHFLAASVLLMWLGRQSRE